MELKNNYVEITNRKQEIMLQRIALNKSNETCDASIKHKKLVRNDAKNDYEFKKENEAIKKLKEIIFDNNETLKKIKAEEKSLNLLKFSRDKDYHIIKNYALGKRESELLNKIKELKQECLADAKNFKINKTVRLIAAEYTYKLDLIIKSHNV